MMLVTIISPAGYQHSDAFSEVAETLHHGLRVLGHEAIISRSVLPGRGRHIVLGAHLALRAGIALPPESIIYNLEQVDFGSRWVTPALLDLYRGFPLWEYSAVNIERLVSFGLPRPIHVPLGYAPTLTRIPNVAPDIDVLFYGSLNVRRCRVLDQLRTAGLRVETLFGVYGAARDEAIARSRLVLNVHNYAARVFEMVRVSYLLANRRVVVSERGADAEAEAPFADGIAFADYDDLVDTCVRLVRDPDARARLADTGFARMAARPVERFLAPALAHLAFGGE